MAEHVRTYGHGSADDPVDVVSIRALARLERTAAQRYDPLAAFRGLPARRGHEDGLLRPRRQASWRPRSATAPACSAGDGPGPLLVDEGDSTCVVPPGCVARLDDHGNIEIEAIDA